MNPEKYHGWSNYETWLINLHIDSEMQAEAVEIARGFNDPGYPDFSGYYDIGHAIIEAFADSFDLADIGPFIADCVNGVLDNVNKLEIGEFWYKLSLPIPEICE